MTRSFFFAAGYANADQPGIQAFTFDDASGNMSAHGSFTGINAPSFLLAHPNKRWLYAVSELGKASHGASGEVWAFRFELEPFNIQPLNRRTSNGDWPCHLQLDATGKWLFTANYGSGNAAVYPIHEDGSLGEMTDFVQHAGKGPNEARQEAAHAHSCTVTPDNRFLIVADLGIDQLVMYQFDSTTGKLKLHESVKTKPGAGPRHLTFHSNSKWMYAANELDNTVTLYDYDPAKGSLTARQSLPTLPANSPESTVADIHLSADNKRLYVSNRGHDSIAVYDVLADGSLKLVAIRPSGGEIPRNFAIAPGGKFLLVANQKSNKVCALPIVEDAEALQSSAAEVNVTGASTIQFITS